MATKIKAFVIDDDEVFGSFFCKMLQKMDVEPWYFSGPSKALDSVEEINPDIIFLDFKMPEMDGDKFMVKYSERRLFTERRVFLVTSLEEVIENLDLYRSLGIENALKKPVSPEALEKIISS